MAAVLSTVSIDSSSVRDESVGNFLALGYAHFQVELLTRALRYTSVLDTEQFTNAVVAAAGAAITGNQPLEHDELSRAFDLMADARNHVYSVDFYVVDLTLVADTTLGDKLLAKLARGYPTNLLLTGEQIERMAREFPETLAELRRSLDAGTASMVGGLYRGGANAYQSPESLLAEFAAGQRAAQQHLGCEYEVFGQFEAEFSPLLPGMLENLSFRGALHVAFDGGRLPRADQRKTNWGAEGSSIEALSTVPLDGSQPETWLKLAERIGDTIAHDHVATVLLAGWPGTECEYFGDLLRVSRFGPVLGKLLTLEEYFRETRAPDDWTNFYPREYPNRAETETGPNAISSRVDAYRRNIRDVQQRLGDSLAAIAGFEPASSAATPHATRIVINPWNAASTQIFNADALESGTLIAAQRDTQPLCLPDVPGCGFASFDSAAAVEPIALAEGLRLRNERLELIVSQKTGGIQSLRTHRDRSTRVSQRLVFHHEMGETVETQMLADEIYISRNEPLVGEITSRGRILGAGDDVLAMFRQRVRAVRGLPAMIVDVEVETRHSPAGDIWKSYFASRLAWAEPLLSVRRGQQWTGAETGRERIESAEWIEVDDGIGRVTCFALGLPFHRIAGPQWLDTLLVVSGEERRRFQFAIGLDQYHPTHAALGLLAACQPYVCTSAAPLKSPRGWFLHFGAPNVLCTHIEPLSVEAGGGIRLRLLETEGRETKTSMKAFRPFQSAWLSDFRGNRTDVLSVSDGAAEIDIGPHGWVQIEAEW
jgi:alpha-mannosidase